MTLPLWAFPALIAALQGLAAAHYLYAGQYRMAIIWASACVGNAAFAGVRA